MFRRPPPHVVTTSTMTWSSLALVVGSGSELGDAGGDAIAGG